MENLCVYTCGDYDILPLPDGGARITGYHGAGGSIAIPQALDGRAVREIGENAFAGCKLLRAVSLPESVAVIGVNAFRGCASLTATTLPDGLAAIEDCAFMNCAALASLDLPEGLTRIGFSAFAFCHSLSAVTLPASLVCIENEAFTGCKSLRHATLRNSLSSLRRNPFPGCDSLTAFSVPSGHPTLAARDGLLYGRENGALLACPGGWTCSPDGPSGTSSCVISASSRIRRAAIGLLCPFL